MDTSVSRLSTYGLSNTDAFPDALVVPEGKSLTLSEPPAGTKKPGYVSLSPKTIDDVKRWLGVPDSVGKRRTLAPLAKSTLSVLAAPAKLTEESLPALRAAAYQYIYGDSTALSQHTGALSQVLQLERVKSSLTGIAGIFLLQDVDVLPNAELKIAAGIKVFYANNVRIWKGGKITILGHVKIDCASVQGNYTAPKAPSPVAGSLNLGLVTDFGG